ncbi:MAG: molybdopterin-dependent oxidoreductase [Alphaproteobacteria bacterium]|nr:molybdopterin-dependent oxidoreductase [Alphaproteobacteria bacterium]
MLWSGSVSAHDPAAARTGGEVLLTINGAIAGGGDDGASTFDRARLEALPRTVFRTTTIWTDGVQTFEGVSLAVLLDAVGAKGTVIRAYALNDYHIDIPVSDAVSGGPIVAYLRNGSPMPRRDKGPLWVVYPYDSNVMYRTESVYARSIWQLDRMEILPE